MRRRLTAAIDRPSVATLSILTGATAALLTVETGLAGGLIGATILGALSAVLTSER